MNAEMFDDEIGAGASSLAFPDDLDHQLSVKITGRYAVKSVRSFEDPRLGLCKEVLDNIKTMGYQVPTLVQRHGMPQIMAQEDMICCSCTGSGKTATYLIPIINMIVPEPRRPTEVCSPKALILAPTRELAIQISTDAMAYAKGLPINVFAVFGGNSFYNELKELKKGVTDILVATPGRLEYFLAEFDLLSLEQAKFFVIDEADEMFNRNFFPQINRIIELYKRPKENRVTAMFSATFPQQIQYFARKHLRPDFTFVVVGTIGGASPNIIQEIIPTSEAEKQMKLYDLLQKESDKKAIVFCNTIIMVGILHEFFERKRFSVTCIHADLYQGEREEALKDFNEGKARILLTTSVAARGLNLDSVALVINYDLPDNIDEYVQRIGRVRTAANGELGVAISFYNRDADAKLFPDLMFALKSGYQPVPEFMVDENQNGGGVEDFDEAMDEDMMNKMQNFHIQPVLQSKGNSDWWG